MLSQHIRIGLHKQIIRLGHKGQYTWQQSWNSSDLSSRASRQRLIFSRDRPSYNGRYREIFELATGYAGEDLCDPRSTSSFRIGQDLGVVRAGLCSGGNRGTSLNSKAMTFGSGHHIARFRFQIQWNKSQIHSWSECDAVGKLGIQIP